MCSEQGDWRNGSSVYNTPNRNPGSLWQGAQNLWPSYEQTPYMWKKMKKRRKKRKKIPQIPYLFKFCFFSFLLFAEYILTEPDIIFFKTSHDWDFLWAPELQSHTCPLGYLTNISSLTWSKLDPSFSTPNVGMSRTMWLDLHLPSYSIQKVESSCSFPFFASDCLLTFSDLSILSVFTANTVLSPVYLSFQ